MEFWPGLRKERSLHLIVKTQDEFKRGVDAGVRREIASGQQSKSAQREHVVQEAAPLQSAQLPRCRPSSRWEGPARFSRFILCISGQPHEHRRDRQFGSAKVRTFFCAPCDFPWPKVSAAGSARPPPAGVIPSCFRSARNSCPPRRALWSFVERGARGRTRTRP